MRTNLFRILLALLIALGSGMAWAQTATPVREITRIAGEVYRFRDNFHYAVFAVTPAGVILADPINADAAKWLKSEIAQRFRQPVKYLIYSHDHADHAGGGEVFADTAIFIGHELTRQVMLAEKRPTAPPTLTFTDRLRLELGGTELELIYTGRNHSSNSIVVRFPKERVLFAVDFIPVKAVAYRDFPDAYMPDWIDSLKRVEELDFDILAPGHGPLGSKANVREFRGYLEALRAEVLKHASEGKTLAEIKELVKLTQYESWAGYKEMFALNLEGMYRMVQAQRRPN